MDISNEVMIKIKAKIIEVGGPRGKLTRNFNHLNLGFLLVSSRKTTAAIRIALRHVDNLFKGATKGYRYKMRFVYAHFPINASITNTNKSTEIRNFSR